MNSPPGRKVLGGILFCTGLVLVVLTGAELFTSSMLTLHRGPAAGSPGFAVRKSRSQLARYQAEDDIRWQGAPWLTLSES